MAAHVCYELQTLVELVPLVARYRSKGPAILQNACLESLLIHARNLIEFFGGRRNVKYSQASHRDYVSQAMSPSDEAKHSLAVIDQYLAHLDWVRARPDPPPAREISQIVDELLSLSRSFVGALKAESSPLANNFEPTVKRALETRRRQ
jgi:hypothetical protein